MSLCDSYHLFSLLPSVVVLLADVYVCLNETHKAQNILHTTLPHIMHHASPHVRAKAHVTMAKLLMTSESGDKKTGQGNVLRILLCIILLTCTPPTLHTRHNTHPFTHSYLHLYSTFTHYLSINIDVSALHRALELLQQSEREYEKMGATVDAIDVYYWLSRVHHQLDNIKERNQAASAFRSLTLLQSTAARQPAPLGLYSLSIDALKQLQHVQLQQQQQQQLQQQKQQFFSSSMTV